MQCVKLLLWKMKNLEEFNLDFFLYKCNNNYMKILRKIILGLLSILIIFIMYITISYCYQKIILKKEPYILGYTSFINTGSSMMPYINVGDLVIVKKENSYNFDDVISFKTNENFVNTHRVVEVHDDFYKTKGDSNKFNDGEQIHISNIYGRVILVVSGFGNIYSFLYQNYLYIFMGLAILSIIIFLIHERVKQK